MRALWNRCEWEVWMGGVNGRCELFDFSRSRMSRRGASPVEQVWMGGVNGRCKKRNRSCTQTHNKNNTTHDTTRTTPQQRNTRHDKEWEVWMGGVNGRCKKINRSHTHTHKPTENNTPDTDTRTHTTRTTPHTPERTPPTHLTTLEGDAATVRGWRALWNMCSG